jgi:hypothetical protein
VSAFEAAVEAQGGKVVARDADDCAQVIIGGWSASVYLGNVRRRVDAGEPLEAAVAHFVRVLALPRGPITDAGTLRAGLRLLLERREVLDPPVVHRVLSREIALVLAWTDPDETSVRLLTWDDLAGCSLQREDAWAVAGRQMDALLSETPIEVDQVAGSPVAMLATESVFKASLIAAPSLREHAEPLVGWPLMAVVPCRDFAYLLPDGASELVGRLGSVVLREFNESPYPLSPEVFRISNEGIEAIGTFGDSAEA